jgi:hypothetical protein
MKFFKTDDEKLRQMLAKAYQEKEQAGESEFWQMRVMNHIRSLPPLNAEISDAVLFGRLVWRFAMVAGLAAIMISAYMFQTGSGTDYDLAAIFADPAGFAFIQYFGI